MSSSQSDSGVTQEGSGDPRVESLASGRRGWGPRVARALLVGLGLVLPLWGGVVYEGRAELRRADTAAARDDVEAQIEHLGRALRWRAPWASHDERALETLWSIGERQRMQQDAGRALALAAYREIRRGLLATRVVDIPHRTRWEQANEHIAALMADEWERGGSLPWTEVRARYAQQLAEVPGPEPIRASMAGIAFVGWLLAVAGFVTRGIDRRGRLRPRAALRWGGVGLLLLLVWTISLAIAHEGL